MIRTWENGVNSEGGENGSPSQSSVGEGGGGMEESPLPPQTTANDRGDSIVCEGPLLTALLNKMETLLDQVCVDLVVFMLHTYPLSLSLSPPLAI